MILPFRHTTLRVKACIYFAAGLGFLWIICNVFLYREFKKTLWSNFDNQMISKAVSTANNTSINPRLIPLPDEGENFLIVYTDFYGTADTLFIPPPQPLNQLLTGRNIQAEVETEEGKLTILYSMPTDTVDKSIRRITYLFLIAFIIQLTLAVALGYWLSGKLIRPVGEIIKLADMTDLQNNPKLLTRRHTEYELNQLTASFNRMLVRIREQTSLQNTFFASASHELRTPLTVMQTRLEVLLSDESINNDAKQAFRQQLKDVRKMIHMVNDFLLMSEVQNGHIRITKTPCDLSGIIISIISRNKQKANERGLRFKVVLSPVHESFIVHADEEKLAVILNNLIVNSLKYTEENELIDIMVEKKESSACVIIRNKIRKGIHPELSALQKSFYHSKPLHGEGSGLGLWISNRLSELNGFTMSVSISGNIFEVQLQV